MNNVRSATVAVLGTLDTKGEEFAFLRACIEAGGVATILIDTGILGEPGCRPDITAAQVAQCGGSSLESLRKSADRALSIATMAAGARAVVTELYLRGDIRGGICLGGGQGSTIGATALHALPVGAPKLIVSTIAGVGEAVASVIGIRDTTLVNSVVDISGLNSISREIIANAAAALVGMVLRPRLPDGDGRAFRVAETMFGVTSNCATRARMQLEKRGIEVLVYAATGSGDQAMEDMAQDGLIDGVLDITTSQMGQGLVRGTFPGGPRRLEVAGSLGIPQVVCPGGLDIIICANHDPLALQAQQGLRLHHRHSPVMTVVRPTATESASIGKELARKLNTATGPTVAVIPLRGFSEYSVAGGPLFDPVADHALIDSFRRQIAASVQVHELDTHINDPEFADELARLMTALAAEPMQKQHLRKKVAPR